MNEPPIVYLMGMGVVLHKTALNYSTPGNIEVSAVVFASAKVTLYIGVGHGCTLMLPRSEEPNGPERELWLPTWSARTLAGPGKEPRLRHRF